jgi:hypothetical protein
MKKFHLKFLKNKSLFSFIVPVIIIALLVGVVLVKMNRDRMVTLKTKIIPDIIAKVAGDPTIKVTSITNMKIASGIYQFDLNLDMAGTPRTFTSYMTKDQKIFFTTGTVVADLSKAPAAAQQPAQAKLTCADVKKSETPKVTAFIVAQCPYGLQMQRVMNKAIAEQPALASLLDVKYMGTITGGKITSMHGDAEAQENLRQICIREEQKTLYWPYVACYMKEGKSDACLTQTGVNTTNLTACTTDANRGIAYAQKDFDLQSKYSIGSSPTLLVNDSQVVSEFDFGGRTADALKQVACCGSTTQGAFCSKELTKTEVATAFSLTEAAAANGSAAANCAPAAAN